jgi:SAM-dependent methyltransferase
MLDLIDGQSFEREPPIGCPLCASDNPSRIFQAGFGMITSVAYCESCRLAYQSPRPSESASSAYMDWRWRSGDDYVSDSPAKRRRAAQALNIALAAKAAPSSLLDFGAGSAIFVREAIARGIRAVGVEQSEGAIEKASEIGIELVREIPEGKFDMITMWDVIEHLRDPQAILRTLAPHLADDGVLVVETGNYESWARCAEGDSWNLYLLDHHFYFTPYSLERLATGAGFSTFELSEAGRMHPSMRLIYRRPWRYLTSQLEYWRARRRWPEHGDINVMVAYLRK